MRTRPRPGQNISKIPHLGNGRSRRWIYVPYSAVPRSLVALLLITALLLSACGKSAPPADKTNARKAVVQALAVPAEAMS